jgi:hypothetical protein
MRIDNAPVWLKALAASLWVAFVLAPVLVWLVHRFGDAALWAALPPVLVAFTIFHARLSEEDMTDAEYYRRKAQTRHAAD